MGEGFSNPVSNALGTLVRKALQSLGFVSGSTGWQILRNGNAEFNGATIRGNLVLGPSAVSGPRMILGETIPSVLSTWAVANGVTIAAVILKYWNDTDFTWEAVGTFSGVNCNFRGTYDTVNGVYVVDRILNLNPGGAQPIDWSWGSSALNPKPLSIRGLFATAQAVPGDPVPARFMVGSNSVTAQITDRFFGFGVGSDTTISGAYSDLNFAYGRVGPAISFQKDYDNTDIEVQNHNTCWASGSGAQVQYGLKVFSGPSNVGNIYDLNSLQINNAAMHMQSSITRCLGFGSGTWLAGGYVFIPEWKRLGGGGTLTMDTFDFSSLQLREVAGENHS